MPFGRATVVLMMTIHVLHAGDGYTYLTDQVASNDQERQPGQELTDYYSAEGTPPGRWWGAGLESLNAFLDDLPVDGISPIAEGDIVTEAHMRAIYGEGLHPLADEIMPQLIAAGMSPDAAHKALRLGRKFPEFKNEVPLVIKTQAAAQRFVAEHGRRPTAPELHQLQRSIAGDLFKTEHGRPASTGRELESFIAYEKGRMRQPVAGLDLVFTPPKSLSVLWALGDDETRRTIDRLHTDAVSNALSWFQDEALYTRTGRTGEQQIDTKGMIVTRYEHYDSRAADPNRHTHAVVSIKVEGVDGVWRSIDTKAAHRHAVACSQRYNALIMDLAHRELGVELTTRDMGPNKQPVIEVAGVGQQLIDLFSSRRSEIEVRQEQLVRQYRDKYGRMPSDKVAYQLFQQATLDTREGKTHPRSLAELRTLWRDRAARELGSEQSVDRLIGSVLAAQFERLPAFAGVQAEAIEVVAKLESRRATWTHPTLYAAVEAHLAGVSFETAAARADAVQKVTAWAERGSIALTTPDLEPTPTRLRRASGESSLTRHGEQLYSSKAVLDAEHELLTACHTPTRWVLTRDQLQTTLDRLAAEDKPLTLNAGQRLIVEHFVGSGSLLSVAIGPAGAGKTTAMRAATLTWEAAGQTVIAIAPSKVAADQLGSDIGASGRTLASLTYGYRGLLPTVAAGTIPDFIQPGTVLLLDEASMAATPDFHALVQMARERGAIVRALGDPYQLDAVETGGMLRQLADDTHAPELNEVVRFGDDEVQAANSLGLRTGDHAAIDMFFDRDWIHDGTTNELKDQIVADHLADTAAGANSIVTAVTVEDVRDLNVAIQQHHRATGRAQTGRTAALADGLSAGVGDTVLTRANRYDLRVKGGTRKHTTVANGDLWTVTKVHRDGGLTLRHKIHKGSIELEAKYVLRKTELGYACTVHRAQGVTVDICRGLVNPGMTRAGAYVQATRGRYQNHFYVPLDQAVGVDTERVHVDGSSPFPTAADILRAVLDNDEGHRSATTELRAALAATTNPVRLRTARNAAQELLRRDWITHVVDRALPASMVTTMATAHPDSYRALLARLAELHDHGHNVADILARKTIHDLSTARDVAALLISELPPPAGEPSYPIPPAHPGADRELRAYAIAMDQHAADAEAAAATARTFTEQEVTYRRRLVDADDHRLRTAVRGAAGAAAAIALLDELADDPELEQLHTALAAAGAAGVDPAASLARALDEAPTRTAEDLAAHVAAATTDLAGPARTDWHQVNDEVLAERFPHADTTTAAWRQLTEELRQHQVWTGAEMSDQLDALAAAAGPIPAEQELLAAWRIDHPAGAHPTIAPLPQWIPSPPLDAAAVDDQLPRHYSDVAAAADSRLSEVLIEQPRWLTHNLPYRPAEPGADQTLWDAAARDAVLYRTIAGVDDADMRPLGPPLAAGADHELAGAYRAAAHSYSELLDGTEQPQPEHAPVHPAPATQIEPPHHLPPEPHAGPHIEM